MKIQEPNAHTVPLHSVEAKRKLFNKVPDCCSKMALRWSTFNIKSLKNNRFWTPRSSDAILLQPLPSTFATSVQPY